MSEKSQTGGPARVLIVDDHPNSAEMLARVLARLEPPVEVLTASSGEQALALAAERGVDVLITDFMMPGLNGLELIEKLNGEHKPGHTILMTAYDTPGLAITARRLQIQDYLVKPVQPEKIRAMVSKVVSELRPAAQRLPAVCGGRILVADDYPDNLRLLSTRLQSEGYHFIPAWDGEETLRLLRAEQPDLLLLDINMPKKDGFEVLAEMRADSVLAHIPVIVITAARIGPRDVRNGLTLGADDYVIKPFDWRELEARIQTKLRVKFAEDGLRRRAAELNLIPELATALAAQPDLEALAGELLRRLATGFQAEAARLDVFLSAEEVFSRRYQAGAGVSICATGALEAHAWGFNATVLERGRGCLSSDLGADPAWRSGETLDAAAMAAALVGPVGVFGVITLLRGRAQPYTAETAALLTAAAGVAAVCIENAQLRERLDRAADMLRSPLMAGLAAAEQLARMDDLPEPAGECVARFEGAAARLKEALWRLTPHSAGAAPGATQATQAVEG